MKWRVPGLWSLVRSANRCMLVCAVVAPCRPSLEPFLWEPASVKRSTSTPQHVDHASQRFLCCSWRHSSTCNRPVNRPAQCPSHSAHRDQGCAGWCAHAVPAPQLCLVVDPMYLCIRSLCMGCLPPSVCPGSDSRFFLAGTVAGMAGVAAGQPFDTIKVRLQTQGMAGLGRPALRTNMWSCIQRTFVNEGVRGFYRGMVRSAVMHVVAAAVFFFSSSSVLTSL